MISKNRPEKFQEWIAKTRTKFFKAYIKTHSKLESELGFSVSFDEWLMVQFLMLQVKGPPGPGEGEEI